MRALALAFSGLTYRCPAQVIGGFRAQGRTAWKARELVDEALRMQDAGVFAIVLECVPGNVAAAITETLEIPTIGIGAGGETSGQVSVLIRIALLGPHFVSSIQFVYHKGPCLSRHAWND
jgi:ketopantoate hydroxymethyltransferase